MWYDLVGWFAWNRDEVVQVSAPYVAGSYF